MFFEFDIGCYCYFLVKVKKENCTQHGEEGNDVMEDIGCFRTVGSYDDGCPKLVEKIINTTHLVLVLSVTLRMKSSAENPMALRRASVTPLLVPTMA
jgi:hypothetical protein